MQFLEAYLDILETHECIDLWFVKVIFLGASRMGKTAACRRLSGVMKDLQSSGTLAVPSTGVVEAGQNIIIKNLSNDPTSAANNLPVEWTVSKDINMEACAFLQFLYDKSQKTRLKPDRLEVADTEIAKKPIESMFFPEEQTDDSRRDSRDTTSVVKVVEAAVDSFRDRFTFGKEEQRFSVPSIKYEPAEDESPQKSLVSSSSAGSLTSSQLVKEKNKYCTEIQQTFRKALNSKHWEDIKGSLQDMVLLKIEDTGGQSEFMDLLPVFTIGPALYLIFCKLNDSLHNYYTESYLSPSGMSTIPEESTYTVEEVLFRALASISCFNANPGGLDFYDAQIRKEDCFEPFNKSIAYIVGTHKDAVSDTQINRFDKKLQKSIQSTDFQGIVQRASQDRMVLPIDNLHGGEDEMRNLRKLLEEAIKTHFRKLTIPASWLMLSLCLRKREVRTVSFESVKKLAKDLSISPSELKLALWFLHHYAGVLMFFPTVPELKETVICDIQVVYDSVTNLIVNTFKFVRVSEYASRQFRETGMFRLEDIRKASAEISGDFLSLEMLTILLRHLNIIAAIKSEKITRTTYFMPCILQNATADESELWWDHLTYQHSPAPLLIRYQCGYVPIGIFPAMIANLAGKKSLKLIVKDMKKNIIQFQYGSEDDVITLFSLPRFYAVHLTRQKNAQTPTHTVCGAVRELVENALQTVTSRMNYSFSIEHQLSFECPYHPARDHVGVVKEIGVIKESGAGTPKKMCCTDAKASHKVDLKDMHLVWFDKVR